MRAGDSLRAAGLRPVKALNHPFCDENVTRIATAPPYLVIEGLRGLETALLWPKRCTHMPDIVLATLNAKYIHASFGLRYLMANLGGPL